jgi:tetratricopeptide (TPR) repeat protein
MHASVGKCNKLLGLIMLQSDNLEAAIEHQEKATLITERVCGRDHSDTITNYMHLGQYYYAARRVAKSLAMIHHARSMCLTTFGRRHPELPSINIQMARGLMDFKEFAGALALLSEALEVQRAIAGEATLLEGHISLLSATAKRELGDHRGAVQAVKRAHDVYVAEFGERDRRAVDTLSTYTLYATEAVRAERLRKLTTAAEADTAAKKKSGSSSSGDSRSHVDNSSAKGKSRRGGGGGSKGGKKAKAKAQIATANGRPGQQSIDEIMSFMYVCLCVVLGCPHFLCDFDCVGICGFVCLR